MPTLEQRFREWQRNRADMRLFRHLAELHQLENEGVHYLTELADHHQLVRASEVFLRPSLFEENPTQTPDATWRQVRQRLFGIGTPSADSKPRKIVTESEPHDETTSPNPPSASAEEQLPSGRAPTPQFPEDDPDPLP